MTLVKLVISDCGDGSSTIHWFKEQESFDLLERMYCNDRDLPNEYMSGDGLQITSLEFPDNFSLETFAANNHIWWQDTDFLDNYR